MQEINVTKILLLGKTGVGKSTFANFILKYDRDVFQKSSSGNSCTREIQSMIGNKNTIASDLLIIDSPGMYDSEKTNEEIIKKIVSQLKENFADGLNCILLFFDGNAPRVDENVEKMIQLYLKIFPIKNFWSHVSLVFTKVYEYFPQQIYQKMKEERTNGFVSLFMEKINNITQKFNENCIEEYNDLTEEEKRIIFPPEIIAIPQEIKTFFVDTTDVMPPYSYQRTNDEINRLIHWAKSCQRLSLDRTSLDVDINFKKTELLKEDHVKLESKKLENEPDKLVNIKFYYKKYKKTTFRDEEIIVVEQDWYKKEEFLDEDNTIEIDENKDLGVPFLDDGSRKKQYFRPHYFLPKFKTITLRKKVRKNPNDINSKFTYEIEKIYQEKLNENEILEFRRDYINKNDIIYEEDFSEVEENDDDYTVIDKFNKKKINKCYLYTQRFDKNRNLIGKPKNKRLIGEETVYIKEIIQEQEPIIIDDKNKKINFDTIQLITKEYNYGKQKIILEPKILTTETKIFKLNHFDETKSESDGTNDINDSSYNISVLKTITKSYDRWDEVDEKDNIINKGQEINVNVNTQISRGERYRNPFSIPHCAQIF